MVKNVLIVADLGACANIVKNLLLTGDYAWPLSEDKFTSLLNQYNTDLQLKDWLFQEYMLRYWKKFFGIDLSDNLDFQQYHTQIIQPNLPIIFINHSAFYQIDEFDKFAKHFDILFICPTTKFGLEWQIRSYCEKKTLPLLHDFSFESEKKQSVMKYISSHGVDKYYEINITNMKEIIDHRQQYFRQRVKEKEVLCLEQLLLSPSHTIADFLCQRFQQDLPFHQIKQLLMAWRHLHWPVESTADWAYHHLFA
jgi:hypothetical protein